jgi:hypothetical protein
MPRFSTPCCVLKPYYFSNHPSEVTETAAPFLFRNQKIVTENHQHPNLWSRHPIAALIKMPTFETQGLNATIVVALEICFEWIY